MDIRIAGATECMFAARLIVPKDSVKTDMRYNGPGPIDCKVNNFF